MEHFSTNKIKSELLKGNNQFLKKCYLEHKEFCINQTIYKTGCIKEEAEDVFGEAILNLRIKIISEKLKKLTNVRNYILGTCINLIKEGRNKKNRLSKNLSKTFTQLQEENEDYFSIKNELYEITKKSFSQLSKNCQQVLKMYYVFGMKMAEIAEELGYANANVAKTTKMRCYKKWIAFSMLLKEGKH